MDAGTSNWTLPHLVSVREEKQVVRSEILEAIEELYKEGMLVKALDESGEPLLRKGQQVYKAIDGATSAERAFWNKENKVS